MVVGRVTVTELVFELELEVDTLLLVLVPTTVGPQSAQTLPACPGLAGVPPDPVSVLVTPSFKS